MIKSQKYEQTRSCAKCGNEEMRFLDELTAAFEETRAWSECCSQCGSTDFSSGYNARPALSRQQLEIWAINDKLHFSQQDEDLTLASPNNLELLLEFLDSPQTHICQRRTLASTLYVLWYDAYPETGESYLENAEFAKKVALEINKRTSLLIELGASESEEFGEPLWYLSNYLKREFEKHKPLPHIIVDGRLDPIDPIVTLRAIAKVFCDLIKR
ncbi:MAG TPA: hypothetical protein VE944_25930 [Nostoc sp.]|uniref:hypothetical protein n=1 Tax=Nostoc sp. TaxID=1180 RepID=UPI002D6ABA1E|nr:hypothetical protein [Nostoc sp.]HYX17733.1 hypothetical protein [Nostoc sp.]